MEANRNNDDKINEGLEICSTKLNRIINKITNLVEDNYISTPKSEKEMVEDIVRIIDAEVGSDY